MTTETRERIERLRALDDDGPTLYEIAHACIKEYSFKLANCEFRNFIIGLLERSDPDGWTDGQLEECGLIRMPRDKDGVIINVGDTVWSEDGREWTVVAIEIKPYLVIYCRFESEACRFTRPYAPDILTHHPPVTVESLLLEFGKICANGYDIGNNIAEYASKLRLAETGE